MINIVFDMDGVLFDTQKIYTGTWGETAKILGIENIEKPAFLCIGRNRNDQIEILKEFYPAGFPFDEFYRLKDKIFDDHIKDGVPLKKGTVEILKYLKSVNARVALASSSRIPVIMHHLEETGIREYFHEVIGGDLVLHSKPSPDIYLKACEMLGTDPESTYGVEDSYNGIIAAAKAGMKVIMIPDVQPPTPEYDKMLFKRFDSLIDLRDYFIEKEKHNG